MTHLIVPMGVIAGVWLALIVQSLAGIGNHLPHFRGVLLWHCPPEDDDVMVTDRQFGYADSRGTEHDVPCGLRSDGASVGSLLPWPFIGLLVRWALGGTPFTGPFRPAAVVHDALYARAEESSFWRALLSPARAEADRVIFEAARCRFVVAEPGKTVDRKPASLVRAFIVLAMLRLAGWKAWIDDSVAARSLAAINLSNGVAQ